jgi:hypothetical protein|nr:hypothetical protein [Kofleriaceae bacterium]
MTMSPRSWVAITFASLVVAGCGSATTAPASPVASAQQPVPPDAPLGHAPTLADLAWLDGDWHNAALDSHWRTIAGAMYGVVLDPQGGFEVTIIDDSDDDGKPAPISMIAISNGREQMTFALRAATTTSVDFAGDHGRVAHVARRPDGWRGAFTAPPQPEAAVDVTRAPAASAPALEAADRAFAADTARDGADGWARAFAPDGAQWERGARIEGDAIRAGIAKTLAAGALAWEPVASATNGGIGYTAGTWTFTANGAIVARGSYVTIWERQRDGSWKVAFDTGRPV